MKHTEDIEKLVERSYLNNLRVPADAGMDERILGDAVKKMEESRKTKSALAGLNIRRIIMRSRVTKTAAAAAIVAGLMVVVFVLDEAAAPAYAIEQTIDAIREVKTVHMAGEFYKQGEFECWMKYEGDPDIPTHVWLGRAGTNLSKICSPDGVFGLNKRTNAVHFARRDERGKTWIIKFGSFFKEAVEGARRTDSMGVYTEGQHIVVHIKTPKREQKFLVDPKTKLPISFSTITDDDPMEMMRETLAVRNLQWIHYNQVPPEGIFDLPADAKVVEDEIDSMVDPDSGLAVDNMTKQQACLEIVRQTGRALVDLDPAALCKLDLFFRLYTPDIWEQLKQMKQAGQWVDELVITGEAYEEDGFWYVPCEIRMLDGKSEVQTPMIKFYEMEGKTLCFIVGSKEKGVVD